MLATAGSPGVGQSAWLASAIRQARRSGLKAVMRSSPRVAPEAYAALGAGTWRDAAGERGGRGGGDRPLGVPPPGGVGGASGVSWHPAGVGSVRAVVVKDTRSVSVLVRGASGRCLDGLCLQCPFGAP